MTHVLLACGHSDNAVHDGAHDGLPARHPSCAIHAPAPEACTVVGPIDLTGRMARCSYSKPGRYGGPDHGRLVPSDPSLAFFEYRGPGSSYAVDHCRCGYYLIAHTRPDSRIKDHEFEQRGPADTDMYYDGCWGWD